MLSKASLLVAVLLVATACSPSEPVASTTVPPTDDFIHNGKDVTEAARVAMWDTQIRGAGSVLSNEDIYRYVIEWANASSDAAQRTLDGEELSKVCWDKMGQFQDDLLGYHMALDEIDLQSTAVGFGIAVGAEAAVTPQSQQQRWLSKCVDEVEAFFDEVIGSGAYDPCEELGKKMNAATSPEEFAAYENLFISCIGE